MYTNPGPAVPELDRLRFRRGSETRPTTEDGKPNRDHAKEREYNYWIRLRSNGPCSARFSGKLTLASRSTPRSGDRRRVAKLATRGIPQAAQLGDGAGDQRERSFAERDSTVCWVKTALYYDPLKSDARWSIFLHKLGLADDQLK